MSLKKSTKVCMHFAYKDQFLQTGRILNANVTNALHQLVVSATFDIVLVIEGIVNAS